MSKLETLVATFQASEGHERRGPCFAAAAYEVERLMRSEVITAGQLHQWFGEPDCVIGQYSLIYFFDHTSPELRRDEWYFLFADGRLVQSGFNRRGINALQG